MTIVQPHTRTKPELTLSQNPTVLLVLLFLIPAKACYPDKLLYYVHTRLHLGLLSTDSMMGGAVCVRVLK